jgi:5-methylcytosine-specific restriction endonuclease McrA
MDHRVPLVRGGRSIRSNLVPACRACNAAKRYLLPVEWDAYLARLAAAAGRNP